MGNEVAIANQPALPAFSMNDIEKVATAIARGGLFGSKDPYAVLTLCMLAHAEGQHPAVVFRDYDLIQGKPAKKAEAMLRDFIAGGGKVTWNRLDDECAEATFSHPQGGEVTINWTLARAQKAQLGGKDMWKKYPRQMLRSRVVSEGVRTIYPNATSGLYVPEEVRDFAPDKAPTDTPPTPEAKRARDLKADAPKQIEATKVDPKRAKAEAWLAWLKDELAATDVDGARALFADEATQKNLARIKVEVPDIYEQAMDYVPIDDGPSPSEQAVDKAIADADSAQTISDLERIITGAELHKEALSDELQIKLEVAFDRNRRRLEQPELAK